MTEFAGMASNLCAKQATLGYVASFVRPIPTQVQLIAFCCLAAYINGQYHCLCLAVGLITSVCVQMDRQFGAVCNANCVAAIPGFSSVSRQANTGSC